MLTQDARSFLEPLGMTLHYHETLKLFLIFFDDSYVYVRPKDLESLKPPQFKSFMTNVLCQYQASDPCIVIH